MTLILPEPSVVEPRAVTRVIVGEQGRLVRGKIAGLEEYDGLTVRMAPNTPRPGDQDHMRAFGAFAQSELGKLYFREPVPVNADGTFQIDGVLPGCYQVFIRSEDKSIFTVQKAMVPAETAGEAPEPLDLGEVSVTRHPAN